MPLNSSVRALFARMVEAGRPALSAGSPADARQLTQQSRAGLGTGPELLSVRDLYIPTRAGNLLCRLYMPEQKPVGMAVYLHGGGWVVGEIDDYDAMARTLARRSHCALLMPQYRLAPEHPFPAGLEDAEDTVVWVSQNMRDLIGAEVPLVVAGDSAGANLATVATHALTRRVKLTAQLLIYPVTSSDTSRPSYLEQSQGMQLTREDMQWFYAHYAPAELWTDPRISPLNIDALDKLPRAVVITAECDVLRDEGEAYAERLAAAGVPVTRRRMDGMPHGFIRMHNLVPAADEALSVIAADLRDACTSPQT
jgi:acetyl esterase